MTSAFPCREQLDREMAHGPLGLPSMLSTRNWTMAKNFKAHVTHLSSGTRTDPFLYAVVLWPPSSLPGSPKVASSSKHRVADCSRAFIFVSRHKSSESTFLVFEEAKVGVSVIIIRQAPNGAFPLLLGWYFVTPRPSSSAS